ncbi:MAG: hypothetical protein ACXW05_13340 [Gemmatirosa sp.]
MIERFVASLRTLAAPSAAELASDDGRRAIADCADALRLELDCSQQEFARDQRAALHRLAELLDDARASTAQVRQAAAETCDALGIACSAAGEI